MQKRKFLTSKVIFGHKSCTFLLVSINAGSVETKFYRFGGRIFRLPYFHCAKR